MLAAHIVATNQEADARLLLPSLVEGYLLAAADTAGLAVDLGEVVTMSMDVHGRERKGPASASAISEAFSSWREARSRSVFVAIGADEREGVVADVETALIPSDRRFKSTVSTSVGLELIWPDGDMRSKAREIAAEFLLDAARLIDVSLGRVSHHIGVTPWERLRSSQLPRESFYAMCDEYILAPDWAVLLGSGHVERLGGVAAVESASHTVTPARVSKDRPSWLAQATANEDDWPEEAHQDWVDFLRPVLPPYDTPEGAGSKRRAI